MSASPTSQVFIVDNLSSVVNDGDARTMIRACNAFLPEVAAAWSVPVPRVLFAKDARPVPPGAWLFHIIDSDPSAPGLLAYHEETNDAPDGFILARTILQNGGAVLYAGSAPTVASALFHEIAETLIDPDCNSWWQAPNGTRFAAEIVDPVQGQIVPITLPSDNASTAAPPTQAPVVVPSVPAQQPPSKPAPPPAAAPSAPTVQPPAPPPAAAPFNLFAPWWQPPRVTEAPAPAPAAPASNTTARWSPWAAPQRLSRAAAAFRSSNPQSCTLGICQAPAANSVPESKCVVGLADFVYPAWSNANAPPGSRFSYTGVVKGPFAIAKGGYAVTTNDGVNGGQPRNVYGEGMPRWMRRAKERAGRPVQRKVIHQVGRLATQTERLPR